MARGVRRRNNTDLGLAVTGAERLPGSDETVAYIALAHSHDAITPGEFRRVSSMRFARQRIRARACKWYITTWLDERKRRRRREVGKTLPLCRHFRPEVTLRSKQWQHFLAKELHRALDLLGSIWPTLTLRSRLRTPTSLNAATCSATRFGVPGKACRPSRWDSEVHQVSGWRPGLYRRRASSRWWR